MPLPTQSQCGQVQCDQPKCVALVLAGGKGLRFDKYLPKQYHTLPSGQFVIRQSIQAFLDHPAIEGVFAVVHSETESLFYEQTQGLPLLGVVIGGEARQDSVLNGLELMNSLNPAYVLVHDGARPFVSASIIQRVVDGLAHEKGVIPVVPVTDTIKHVQNGRVFETLDRSNLVRVQTPQGFKFKTLYELHQRYKGQNFTDDAALFEKAGVTVLCVDGCDTNIKITTKKDIV